MPRAWASSTSRRRSSGEPYAALAANHSFGLQPQPAPPNSFTGSSSSALTPKVGQRVEVRDHVREGSVARARLRGERADVQLVDHRLPSCPGGERRRAPRVRAGVDHHRGSVRGRPCARVEARERLCPALQREAVALPCVGALDARREHPAALRDERVVADVARHRRARRARRPHAKRHAARVDRRPHRADAGVRADVEGRPDVAGLFKDTADGETGHAHGHLDFLKQVGDPETGKPIGSTAKNLAASVAGETHEYETMYPGMAKTAREEGFAEVAEWFETLAKAEKSHAGRFAKALKELES